MLIGSAPALSRNQAGHGSCSGKVNLCGWIGASHSVSFCPKWGSALVRGQLQGHPTPSIFGSLGGDWPRFRCQSIQEAPPTGFILRPSFLFSSRRLCYHLPFTRRKLRQGAGAPWAHTADPGGLGHKCLMPAIIGPVWV